jgi:hypothetical protein
VLEETLQGLGGLDARTQAHGAAAENVARWKQEAASASPPTEAAKVREELDRYHADTTDLISARHGRVYLGTDTPRVCTPASCACT